MRFRCLAWILLPIPSVALVACFGSSSPPLAEMPFDGGGESTDASPTEDVTLPEASPAPEAAAVESGVDGGAGGAVDAGVNTSVDAGSDVTGSEASVQPLPVTVIVVGPGGPEAGKTIVFSDANGLLLATGTTNAAGTVVQPLAAGSQVTALLGTIDSPQIVTVVAVQPGDTLTAIDGAAQSPDGGVELDVSLPSLGGAEDYLLIAGTACSQFVSAGESPSADIDVGGCVNAAGQFPLLALARDSSGTIGFQYQKPIAATAGGTVAMSGAWASIGTETVNVAGLSQADYPYVMYSEVASGIPYSQINLSPDAVDAGGVSASFDTHPGYADFIQTEVSVQQSSSGRGSVTAVATRATPPVTSGSASYDSSDLLPQITDATLDASDPTRPSVTWTAAASLSSAVGVFTEMSWTAFEDGGTEQSGTWTVVAPSDAAMVKVPVLPPSSLAPGADASWNDTPTVGAVAGGGLVDYAALRSTVGSIAAQVDPSSQPLIPPLAANGAMKITVSYQVFDNE